jgi:hypothetical protein
VADQPVNTERSERHRHRNFQSGGRDHHPGGRGDQDNCADCQAVPESQRDQSSPDCGGAPFLHSQRHGKQPAHPGIDAMKGAQQQDRG